MKRAACLFAVLFAFAACAAPPAMAQEPEEDAQGIPAYAVARLKVLDGSVWVRTEADGEWEEFETNSPVPPGSRVSVPASSEGELQFHGGQFVLLTSGTDLEVREFQEGRSSFRIRAGEVRFDLTQDDFAPVTVRVPGGARVEVPQPGKYWVVVDDGKKSRLVVRSGEATVVKGEEEFPVRGGEQAVIGEEVSVARFGEPEPQAESPPPEESGDVQVPPSVNQELQDYGEWVTVPEYGHVWRPYVATGWTPYVYGRWVWISPYGWTWVSNEPWGWYPYRCGYWVTIPAFGWVWYPYNAFVSVGIGVGYGTPRGPYYGYGGYRYYHRHAYYYPANVRFVPEGRQVRWVPLRPGERYRPSDVRRGDASLARWNRPLESNRVYVRSGPDSRQTRDYTVVRKERQAELRRTLPQRTRTDTRPLRPEKMQDGRATQQQPQRRTSQPANSGTGQRPAGRSGVAPSTADGKSKSPSGRTYIPSERTYTPRDAAPEKGRVDKERRPTGAAPATPPADGKSKSPKEWRYIPRDTTPELDRFEKESHPPGAAPATPPSTGTPLGNTRGRVPAQKSPAVVPPPTPRQETPAVVQDAAGEVGSGDGGSRSGDGGVRGGGGGSRGGGSRGDTGSRGGGDGIMRGGGWGSGGGGGRSR